MKKLYISLLSSLLVISTGAVAEEAELLDTYLEELPTSSTSANSTYQANESVIVGQPVETVIDENGVSRDVVQPQTVQYRRIQSADGTEIYEAVPMTGSVITQSAGSLNTDTNLDTHSGQVMASDSDVIMVNEVDVQSTEYMEVIELEPLEDDYVVIEAPAHAVDQTGVTRTNQPINVPGQASVSGQGFCQQNPYARECLLSKYLSLCKKDPQSADCKSELQKFDNFCGTFPNAYKCKKAKIAASCKQNPESGVCKSFGQRYCQKYPKAIFCNYN